MGFRKKLGVIALGTGTFLVGGTFVGLDVAAARAADKMNAVYPRKAPYKAPAEVRALHDRLLIADLHADSLLWSRDLLDRATSGHVDVPRLIEANVALQIFGVVTKTPKNMNADRNGSDTDQIRLLAIAQRWPPGTWTSLRERALYQAAQLHQTAERSGGKLRVIRTRADLRSFLDARAKQSKLIAGLLALEGMHALEGDAKNVDALYDAGFRMLGFAHFFDNEASGSAHGVDKHGLTKVGRAVLARMEERGMVVDLAHASAKTFDEVLRAAKKPVVVSHTGVKGTCKNNRNLTDLQLRAVAKNGGVVGIGYWKTATCGTDAKAIAKAIRHAVDVAGVDHVALGSDFDGAVVTPFDVAGLPELTAELVARGFGEPELRKIYGDNVIRVLSAALPE